MEQMVELINEAGYNASLHAIGDVQTILIAVLQDGFSSYFVVYDKGYFDPGTRYTLTDAASSIGHDDNESRGLYTFLAPTHILVDEVSYMRKVYGSFEDIAEFYSATGKDDVVIDDVDETILFWCGGSYVPGARQGTLIMQYTKTETGNYLEIKPLPVNPT